MNVIITGAAKGLGAYLVRKFAENQENSIIGIDVLNREDLQQDLVDMINHYYQFDLRNYLEIPNLVANISNHAKRIDLWINNAGLKTFGKLNKLEESLICDTIFVNYLTPILVSKCLLEKFKKQDEGGMIINISSNAAFKGYSGGSIYCGSKAGLNITTESIFQELNEFDNIGIYNICPSTIYTGEIKRKFPKANPKNYVSEERIYHEICRIIKTPPSISIIPVFSLRQNLKHILRDLKRYSFWLTKTIPRKLI